MGRGGCHASYFMVQIDERSGIIRLTNLSLEKEK